MQGSVGGGSPFSVLADLDALCLTIEAKRALWQVLARLGETDGRFSGVDFGDLVRGAEVQRDAVERVREEVARLAFGRPRPTLPQPLDVGPLVAADHSSASAATEPSISA